MTQRPAESGVSTSGRPDAMVITMPGWTPFADWMAFSHLDDGAGLTRTLTLAYKITDDSGESPNFRRGNPLAMLVGSFLLQSQLLRLRCLIIGRAVRPRCEAGNRANSTSKLILQH